MAETLIPDTLRPEVFSSNFFTEYVNALQFKPWMGTDENAVIQVVEDLTAKKGQTVVLELVNRLTGEGVVNGGELEGNEESLDQRSFRIEVQEIGNAVRVSKCMEQYTQIEILQAGKTALKTWIMEKTRDDIITALGSIDGVTYSLATEGQKDTWVANNSDRVLFGDARGNYVASDHSASLANITAAMQLTPGIGRLAKRMAKQKRSDNSPKIRPFMTEGTDKQFYVMFCNSRSFRDLTGNSSFQQSYREAADRGDKNLIFTDGSAYLNGILYVEIEDIDVIEGVGSGGIDIAPNYLCGAQALAVAYAEMTKFNTKPLNYGRATGVAVSEIRGIKKVLFGTTGADTGTLKQHGVVTIYTAGEEDA